MQYEKYCAADGESSAVASAVSGPPHKDAVVCHFYAFFQFVFSGILHVEELKQNKLPCIRGTYFLAHSPDVPVIDRFASVDHGKDADYVLNKLLLKEAALISTSKLAISIISSIIQMAKNAD